MGNSMNDLVNVVGYDIEKLQSNIVPGKELKRIQRAILADMKNAILPSMGPAGSNTLILKGANSSELVAEYSKDGNKIIKNIKYENPIEMSIQTEIEEITRYVERTSGDGTSSAVVMSSYIFDALCARNSYSNPYQLIRDFKDAVALIKNKILSHKKECTLEDIYNICYISTNGNKQLSEEITQMYKDLGMNVFIDVSESIDENSYWRKYDGLTLDAGYSDAAFINTQEGVSRITGRFGHPLRIYAFEDPVDTPQMISYFEKIVLTNVLQKLNTPRDIVPTVVMAPKFSRDASGLMRQIVSHLYTYDSSQYTQKPPLLIITNIDGISLNHYQHITQLCGCKMIRKYIDPQLEKADQERGLAPTLDTILDFYGTAEAVQADANCTKFKSPAKMYKKDSDGNIIVGEDGYPILGDEYNNIITFLNAEMKRLVDANEHGGEIGSIKRQINALKANMVEYFVGGVSVSDRDSLRDLVEDAVLNCRSAAANGVGYGANYEGLYAAMELLDEKEASGVHDAEYNMLSVISDAYKSLLNDLYSTAYDSTTAKGIVNQIIDDRTHIGPYNIYTNEFDKKVLTSITSDITILDAISKIITIMFTSNQALVQAPRFNMYRQI